MTPEELNILEEIVKKMREGKLTKTEKAIFVIGIQSGLYSSDKTIKKLLNEVADICLCSDEDMAKEFDN